MLAYPYIDNICFNSFEVKNALSRAVGCVKYGPLIVTCALIAAHCHHMQGGLFVRGRRQRPPETGRRRLFFFCPYQQTDISSWSPKGRILWLSDGTTTIHCVDCKEVHICLTIAFKSGAGILKHLCRQFLNHPVSPCCLYGIPSWGSYILRLQRPQIVDIFAFPCLVCVLGTFHNMLEAGFYL